MIDANVARRLPRKRDARVIGAEAFDGKIIPIGWKKEILKAGFAIIHDKIMVIDPFSGSGSIPLAAARLGRQAIGIELDAEWAERSQRRILEATTT